MASLLAYLPRIAPALHYRQAAVHPSFFFLLFY